MAKIINKAEQIENKAERIASPKLLKKLSGKTVKEIKELYGLRDRTAKYLKLPDMTVDDKIANLPTNLQQVAKDHPDTVNSMYKKVTKPKMSYKNYLIKSISEHKKNVLTEKEYYERERTASNISSKSRFEKLNSIIRKYEKIYDYGDYITVHVKVEPLYDVTTKLTDKQFWTAYANVSSRLKGEELEQYVEDLVNSVRYYDSDKSEKRRQHNMNTTAPYIAEKINSLFATFYEELLNVQSGVGEPFTAGDVDFNKMTQEEKVKYYTKAHNRREKWNKLREENHQKALKLYNVPDYETYDYNYNYDDDDDYIGDNW